eukprot:gene1705-4830_t
MAAVVGVVAVLVQSCWMAMATLNSGSCGTETKCSGFRQGNVPVTGSEDIMKPKAFGTCSNPVYEPLRWGCDAKLANKICAHNRHYAEHSGYFEKTNFLKEVDREHATTFYDPMTLKPLFCAPQDRTFKEFELESRQHGWPSFRDKEVNWENVRVLPDGEVVSITGTHLGHNLPDKDGNRYCINLVCIAGNPTAPTS